MCISASVAVFCKNILFLFCFSKKKCFLSDKILPSSFQRKFDKGSFLVFYEFTFVKILENETFLFLEIFA